MPKSNITIPIFIPHSGCPNRCLFCNQWRSSGASSIPDSESLRRHVSNYLSARPASVNHIEIAFFGGNFTGIPVHQQEKMLLAALDFKKSGSIDAIRISTRPDYIDRDIVKRLLEYSVDTVEMGIQSFNDRVLSAARRGHGIAESMKAMDLLSKNGINYVIQLMAGLPESTEKDDIDSAETAAHQRPAGVRIFPVVVLKDTGLEELYRSGLYTPLTMEEAVERCKNMLAIFNREEIPVIRTGLHPLKPEEEREIVAGPYHPAFGFLVKSRIKRDMMEVVLDDFIRNNRKTSSVKFAVPEKGKEEYLGHRKENIIYLEKRFSEVSLSYDFVDADKIGIKM